MRTKTLLVILFWLAATILIAPRVDVYDHTYVSARQTADMPALVQLLGEARSIVSNMSLLQADLYMHGGVGHFEDEHGIAIIDPENLEEHVDKHKEVKAPEGYVALGEMGYVRPYNILLRMSDLIDISEHIHLQGEDMKEIVPWLYYSVKIDPHNVLAITLTSYYLSEWFGKPDEAFGVLRDGLKNNPDSWQINAELGRMYFTHTGDYETAVRYLSRAYEFLMRSDHDKFEERYVLTYLIRSYEALGQEEKTLPMYKRLNELFPQAAIFQERIRQLSHG